MDSDCDRLSDLPDSVLTTILSLLRSRQVAQTCILSKRWSKSELWASVPCLNFKFADFKSKESQTEETSERDQKRFENFVSQFLNLREDGIDIDKFKLKSHLVGSETVQEWILSALKHKPKTLHLVLDEAFDLPDSLFTCESLEEAYLSFTAPKNYVYSAPDTVIVPKLRTLQFSNVWLNEDCIETILSGCSALESLSLYACCLKTCDISNQTLKCLSLVYCDFYYKLGIISISCPNLEYLKIEELKNDESFNFPPELEGVSMVTKAIISMVFSPEDYDGQLLSELSGVEDLELRNPFLKEMLTEESLNCPIFFNLKILTLAGCCMYCNFDPIPSFLERCPNLEHLILLHDGVICQENFVHDEEEEEQNLDQKERFYCKKLRLVDVRYRNFNHEVHHLKRLVLHSTSKMGGVQINFTEEPAEQEE